MLSPYLVNHMESLDFLRYPLHRHASTSGTSLLSSSPFQIFRDPFGYFRMGLPDFVNLNINSCVSSLGLFASRFIPNVMPNELNREEALEARPR